MKYKNIDLVLILIQDLNKLQMIILIMQLGNLIYILILVVEFRLVLKIDGFLMLLAVLILIKKSRFLMLLLLMHRLWLLVEVLLPVYPSIKNLQLQCREAGPNLISFIAIYKFVRLALKHTKK